MVPSVIANDLKQMVGRVAADPSLHMLKQGVRAFNRLFSGWTIAMFPATWLNNVMGNLWSNFVAGAGYKPWELVEAHQILRGAKKTIDLGKNGVVDKGTLMQAALKGQVLRNGFQGLDLHEQFGRLAFNAQKPNIAQRLLEPGLNPITRTGFGVMQWGDDVPKLAHYLAKLRKGDSFEEASASVMKYLYGGQPLTGFEEGVRNYAMPFYAWSRFNYPRSLMNVIEHPGKIAPWGRVKMQLDEHFRGDIPDEFLPTYIHSQVGVPVSRGKDGLQFWAANRWIPLAQLQELRTPKSAMEFLISQFSPLWKEPVQQAQNFDFFYHQAIRNYPGETESFLGLPFAKKTSHLMRNLRLLDVLDRTFNPKASGVAVSSKVLQDLTAAQRALVPVMGRPSYTVSLQRARAQTLRRYASDAGRLKRAIREAHQAGKANVVAALRERLLEQQRKQRVLASMRLHEWPQLADPNPD